MKKKVKSESKKIVKRKISIITTFVGILLLFTIGTISLKGLNKTNSLEDDLIEDIQKIYITKTSNEKYPYIGEEFKYTIKIENKNDFIISGKVIDNLPDGLEFLGASDGGTYDEYNNTVTWNEIIVGYNASKEVLLWVKAKKSGEITNEAKFIVNSNEELHGNVTIENNTTVTIKNVECKITWYDEDKSTVLDTNIFNQGEAEPSYSEKLPSKENDENYIYEFEKWILQDTPLNDDNISYVAQYRAIPIEYGSYIVKHEYYTRDKDGNVVLDKTILEDEIRMEAGTIIDNSSIERKPENYIFSEISESIMVEKDKQKVITIKYIKDKEYIENTEDNVDNNIVKNIENIDTSDINIFGGIGIFIIAIVGVIISVLSLNKAKNIV